MFYLAWRNAMRRLGRSALTAVIVLVAVATAVASLGTVAAVENGIDTARERLGADVMVLPAAASTNAQEVLFTAQPINVYLPESVVADCAAMPGVAQASPQFFTQTVNESCCSVVGITRVVGISESSDFVVTPWIEGGSAAELGADGIYVGANAPEIVGGQASILGSTFHVVATLEPTGTSVDETIFMDMDAARRIAKDSPYLAAVWGSTDPATSISAVMVRLEEGADADEVAARLTAAVPGSVAVSTSSLVSGVSDQLRAAAFACLVLVCVLIFVSAVALGGRISALVSSRMGEWGLLRSLGASTSASVGALAAEIGIITLPAAVVGAVVGCALAAWVSGVLHSAFNFPGATANAGFYLMAGLLAVAACMALDALFLAVPMSRIAKMDAHEAIAKGGLQ